VNVEAVELGEWTSQVEVKAGIAARRFSFKAGQVMPGHKHQSAHATVVLKGELLLILTWDDGRKVWERTYKAGDFFEVPADAVHQVRAVSDVEWLCLFADPELSGWVDG